ncbi:MAG: hypothetical protein Q7W51_01510 [Coriobacteriia bacterium]|nr:hypothetical protein [Coriobacteriia bacterium]
MVKRETCPICKGNKVVESAAVSGSKDWRKCHACNGAGYQIRVVHGIGCSVRY